MRLLFLHVMKKVFVIDVAAGSAGRGRMTVQHLDDRIGVGIGEVADESAVHHATLLRVIHARRHVAHRIMRPPDNAAVRIGPDRHLVAFAFRTVVVYAPGVEIHILHDIRIG